MQTSHCWAQDGECPLAYLMIVQELKRRGDDATIKVRNITSNNQNLHIVETQH